MERKWMGPRLAGLALVFLSLGLSSCNLFGGIDNPSGDPQILSAARAAFDEGRYEDALELYKQLSNAENDVRTMEEAFVLLDKSGVGMATFFSALSKGNIGTGLTRLADALAGGASTEQRRTLFLAYKKAASLSKVELRGFARFVTATVLAAEVLAENTGGDKRLQKTDIGSSNSCTTSSCTATISSTSNPGDLDSVDYDSFDSTVGMGSSVGLFLLQRALLKVEMALNGELGAVGKFNSGSLSFVTQFASLATKDTLAGFLIQNGVGADQ